MNFMRPPVALFAAAAAAIPLLCLGQQPASAVPQLQRIEVTGSNIRRTDAEGALPLQTITREELERAAVHSAQDIFDRISAHQSVGGWNENLGIGSSVAGTTAVALRGLGGDRTLILLNGHRIAPYALSGGSGPDLSSIPVAALERVEVLKDGASAIYGSDAIAGVVNFILRQDYRGAEVGVSGLATQHGGSNSWRANAIAGGGAFERERYNWFILADHSKQHALSALDRESTRTGYLPALGYNAGLSAAAFPANFVHFPGGSPQVNNPSVRANGASMQSCAPPLSIAIPQDPGLCYFDGAASSDSIPKSERTSLLSRLTVALSPATSLFAELSAYQGAFTQHLGATPVIADARHQPIFLFPSSPFFPAAFISSLGGDPSMPIGLIYRLVELGQRVNEVRSRLIRGAFGLQGIVGGWEYQLSLTHSANRQESSLLSGYVDYGQLRALLESGEVNPFGPNNPELLARMRATQVNGLISENRASLSSLGIKVSGSAAELANGPLAIVIGLETHRESLKMTDVAVVRGFDVLGIAPDSLSPVDRGVMAMFGEAIIPVTKSIEASLAVRADNYSDFGTTTNPKATVRWQAFKDAVLRASYGTGFRAPQLYVLRAPTRIDHTDRAEDPLRCPVTGSFPDCGQGFDVHFAGNSALNPEKSRQFNVGAVLAPTPSLSAAVDYYRVAIRDVLSIIPADAILASAGSYPSNVIRRAPDEAFPGLPGPIDHIVTNFENLGRLRTSGVDIDLRARIPDVGGGWIRLSLTGTYVIDYRGDEFSREAPGAGSRAFGFGAVSRWRHHASIDWARGAWGTTVAQTFQNGYAEPDLRCSPCTGTRRVGSYEIWDVIARYEPSRTLAFAFGVRNVLDRAPPVSTQTQSFQPGIDPTYADPRGRMFHATARYSFR